MKTLITSFFFLIISVCSYGQNMDSLYHLYLSSKGEKRIAVVNEISQAAFDLELNDSLYHLDHKAKPELAAAIVNEIMTVHAEYTLNDLNKAIAFALEAAQLYEQLDKVKEMDLNLSAAGVYYYRMGDYEKAIEIMLRCYELEKSLNNMTSLSTTLNNLGIAYSNWGYNKAAIEYFRKAIEIERPLNRPMQYAGRLSSLAKELALSGNYQESIALIKEALVYDQKIEGMLREDRLGAHNIIMGDIYAEADSLKQAEQCYKYAVSIFEKINRQQLLASSLLGLGRLKLKMNRYTEAIEILKYCVEVSEKNQLLGIIQKANRLLYETYKRIGSSTLALAHLEQSIALDTLIFKETTQKQISEFQVKYETAEKQLEIERKQTEIDRYQTRQFIFIGGIIALGLLLTLLGVIVVQRTRRNRDLAEMNAIKDKFFRIISHDLHNPAIAQRDALQMLAENANQWDNKTLSDYYQQLNRSANHLVALVKNLLDWAKMQTEHEIYRPVSFSLVSALQPDIGIIKSLSENKNITFETSMPQSVIITGDKNMLVTVIRNLLTNAVKFTDAGGKVILDISPCECDTCGDVARNVSTKYVVSISDTGTGMTPEQMQNLFHIDRQYSKRGTANETGSGLGLIVCRDMLQKHGSSLNIESQEGKGSKFWFEI